MKRDSESSCAGISSDRLCTESLSGVGLQDQSKNAIISSTKSFAKFGLTQISDAPTGELAVALRIAVGMSHSERQARARSHCPQSVRHLEQESGAAVES
jgi:hypothetical protein